MKGLAVLVLALHASDAARTPGEVAMARRITSLYLHALASRASLAYVYNDNINCTAEELSVEMNHMSTANADGDSFLEFTEGWATDFEITENVNVVANVFDKDDDSWVQLDVNAIVSKTAEGAIRVGLPTVDTANWVNGGQRAVAKEGSARITFCTTRVSSPTCTRVRITEGADAWSYIAFRQNEAVSNDFALFAPPWTSDPVCKVGCAFLWSKTVPAHPVETRIGPGSGNMKLADLLYWPLPSKYICDEGASWPLPSPPLAPPPPSPPPTSPPPPPPSPYPPEPSPPPPSPPPPTSPEPSPTAPHPHPSPTQERRQVQETKMNKTSSRSHCVFTLRLAIGFGLGLGLPTRTLTLTLTSVTSKSPTDDGLVECSGKLHMVDLAGSECAKVGATAVPSP